MNKNNSSNITLCFPDSHKTCFACCPPIRPKGYEHIQYRHIISRILRENTSNYPQMKKDIIPITGFSCWALGYLDNGYKMVGCLLHPDRNQGRDLRYRIDYGDKCRRESCWESRTFGKLSPRARRVWLGLCDGMDSFEYSSRKHNPLFHLLGWGHELLEELAFVEGDELSCNHFFHKYPFFEKDMDPRSHAYLVLALTRKHGTELLEERGFALQFKRHSEHLRRRLKQETMPDSLAPYTHLLNMDSEFLDFLRLGLGLKKITHEMAAQVKQEVDRWLDRVFI